MGNMESWASLLIQVPLVGVFIWYSLESQKRYQASMDKRDEAYLTALDKITDRMDTVEDIVLRIDERTKPRAEKQTAQLDTRD
jgi:hypothetical protein